jgi:CheY-like chemotaxis protein
VSARKILLVEDNLEFRTVLSAMLRRLGFEVVVAVDGADAIEKFSQSPTSLVATDWEMPGLDGAALIGELRRREPNLPIIVISGLAFETPPGADAYVSKAHFTPAAIAAEVKSIWQRFFPECA